MDNRSEVSPRQALQIWQSRQHADGRLVAILIVAALVPTAFFALNPGTGAALVMAIYLMALVMACCRLLNSAAAVAHLRPVTKHRHLHLPEVIEAEILDVYEKPAGLNAPPTRSVDAYWLEAARFRSAQLAVQRWNSSSQN